jgi:hypothetical protein
VVILLKITEKEKPVVLEALHFFGSELQRRLQSGDEQDPTLEKIVTLDQIIDVIQLTDQKPVC